MPAQAINLDLGRHAMELAQQEWGLQAIGPHLTALLPLKPASELQRRWHVVQIETQQTDLVTKRIEKLKLDAYNPCEPKSVRINAMRRRTVMRPMLVGYLFVGFDVSHDRWPAIIDLPGVLRLIMVNCIPVPVADCDIANIRALEAERALGKCRKPRIPFEITQLVQLTEEAGPWSHFLGTVLKLIADKDRIVVGIDLFGRQTPVEVSVNQVRAV